MKDGNAKSFFIKVIDVTVSQNLYFFGAPFSKWYEQKRAEDFGKVYPRIPLFLTPYWFKINATKEMFDLRPGILNCNFLS